MSKTSWWKQGPIYQIYPRSFLDTNHDGIGDLEGIRRKLDYLMDLGIRGIWLSPVYPSPMADFGYDVSCYHEIDPVFGTLEDMKHLIKEADNRGISIIMDMVLNHTSHEHPWFIEASRSRENPRHDWYVWHEGKPGFPFRHRPNNWMAAFGGHAWDFNTTTDEYYLHLFTKEQPDLNWRNPKVEQAMFGEMRFWLDLGVKGFRLDVINYLVKDQALRSNPYSLRLTYPRRHELQHHLHDRNQPETLEIIGRLRTLMDSYGDTMLVGEVYPDEGVRSPELAGTYIGNGQNLLHMAFDFSPIYTRLRADAFKAVLKRWYNCIPASGWPCHVLSNHDQSRALSRYFHGSADRDANSKRSRCAKLLATLLLTQRGTPFLYYGEEIGMMNGNIPRASMQDPLGKKYWPFHPGRDRSRTPMQWNTSQYAGFSDSKPWLPVNPDYTFYNVEVQEAVSDSIHAWYKQLLALRASTPAMHSGTIDFAENQNTEHSHDILQYRREDAHGSSMYILINFSPSKNHTIAISRLEVVAGTDKRSGSRLDSSVTLAPYEAIICKAT